jgi:hypothetical protein
VGCLSWNRLHKHIREKDQTYTLEQSEIECFDHKLELCVLQGEDILLVVLPLLVCLHAPTSFGPTEAVLVVVNEKGEM